MKKTILLSSLFAVGAAFAATEVDSGNAVGALDLSVSNNVPSQQQTLISVPFVGYETGGAVKVADMVMTSNLADGSKLYVANATAGGYDSWKLEEGTWKADKKVTIGPSGVVEGEALDQNAATVPRGGSFWLEPQFSSGTEGTIYLLGQKGAGDGVSAATGNAWNLLGNASVGAVQLENNSETSGFTDGDQVVVQVNGKLRYYTYKGSKGGWRYTTSAGKWSVPSTDRLTIAAGQGFWFRSATAKNISWTDGKVVAP